MGSHLGRLNGLGYGHSSLWLPGFILGAEGSVLIQKCQDHPSPFVGMRGGIMSLACKIWAFISLVSVYLLYGWFSLAVKCEGIRIGAGSPAPQIHFL